MRKKVGVKREIEIPKHTICSPEYCEDCCYVGEGDFLCNRYADEKGQYHFVMEDFEPTEYYGLCNEHKKNITIIRKTKNPEDVKSCMKVVY